MLDFGDPAIASEWLHKGSTALTAFWRPDEACFLRATGPALVGGAEDEGGLSHKTGATSSNRAFLATTEILFHLAEEKGYRHDAPAEANAETHDRWQQLGESLEPIWRSMAEEYYLARSLDELRSHSDNGQNDFTDAHLMIALSVLTTRFAVDHLQFESMVARRDELETFVGDYESCLHERGGARIADSGPTHPLLTLHGVRAVEVGRHVTGADRGRSRVTDALEAKIRSGARDDLLRQLGLHAAEDAEFDPAALLGDVALLHRFAGMSARRLVEKGVLLLGETQGFDGSWKTQILTGSRKLVYLPSLELSVTLANLVLADLTEGSTRLAELAMPILERSLAFLEAGYRESQRSDEGPAAGWMNDQARQPEVVESWSTALALQLLLRVRRISRRVEQHAILKKYRTTQRDRLRREWLRWPDLTGSIPLVRSGGLERERAIGELKRVSDPSSTGSVKHALTTEIVERILDDPFDRPVATRSFVLYGPPGTRKSTMVGAVAAALDWPMVTLAPPDFLKAGIVGLEARAEEIFLDLLKLRRVVIFFDECEELFRRRTLVNSPEHRTQSDFITSGMLPRLQDLREEQWVVFAIATNTELDELDPAVVRFGRIDGQQRIGHPDVGAQVRYLHATTELSADAIGVVEGVLTAYDQFLESQHKPKSRSELEGERRQASEKYQDDGLLQDYFKKAESVRARESELPLVTFSVLDALAKHLGRDAVDVDQVEVREMLEALSGAKGRPKQWTEVYGPDQVPAEVRTESAPDSAEPVDFPDETSLP